MAFCCITASLPNLTALATSVPLSLRCEWAGQACGVFGKPCGQTCVAPTRVKCSLAEKCSFLPPFCKRWIKRRPLLRDFCLFYFYFILNDDEVCPVYRLSFWGLGRCLQLCWGCSKHVATCLVAGTWSWTMCCWTMRDTASWQTSECARRAFTMALPQLPSAVHQTILLQRYEESFIWPWNVSFEQPVCSLVSLVRSYLAAGYKVSY